MIFWPKCSVVRPSLAKSSLVKSTPLPIKRQCELLNIARPTAYYQPIGLSAEEIELRRIIDEIHL